MKYEPITVPRKTISGQPWFDLIRDLNMKSIKEKKHWQEKGARHVSGWAVMNPQGYILPSTFANGKSTAKSRCMTPALQRFKGIISNLFSEWEKEGYKVVKVMLEVV